jgi:uncharacterized protein YbjT (DUF2867 family)
LLKSKCKYTFASVIKKQLKQTDMKYVITGSTGHISKPITQQLTKAGHDVTVITHQAAKTAEIQALGAKAAVGSVENLPFLTQTFAGADAVYLMIPPKWDVAEWFTYQKQVADNYLAALVANNVKHVVVLSSVGAHMRKGCGPVDGSGYLEEIIAQHSNINTRVLRPTYFYYNLLSQINMIKNAGFVGSVQPADFKLGLTHTSDIADAAAAYLLNPTFTGFGIHYLASDDTHTWAEITKTLGAAIGKPELPYVELTDEQFVGGLKQAGLSQTIIDGYAAMGKALREGKMQADYWQHRPQIFGKIKLNDFAKEFAAAYSAAN